jgi:hypothetical protein
MKLPIPIWLAFLLLCVASFAPVASRWPDWWMAYYGALLVCWALMSVVAMRRVAREDRETKVELARVLRQLRDLKRAEAAETATDVVRHVPAKIRRRIIVAGDDTDLNDDIRRDQVGDEQVVVIPDRRRADRRDRMDRYVVERRRAERRRYDIGPLLLAQGWAEVQPLTSEGEDPRP